MFGGTTLKEKAELLILSLLLSCYLGYRTQLTSQNQFFAEFPTVSLTALLEFRGPRSLGVLEEKFGNGPGAAKQLWDAAPRPPFTQLLQCNAADHTQMQKKRELISLYQNPDKSLKRMTLPVLSVFIENLTACKLDKIEEAFAGRTLHLLKKIRTEIEDCNEGQALKYAQQFVQIRDLQRVQRCDDFRRQIEINFPLSKFYEDEGELVQSCLKIDFARVRQFGFYSQIEAFLHCESARELLVGPRVLYEEFVLSWSQVLGLIRLCQKLGAFCLETVDGRYTFAPEVDVLEQLKLVLFGQALADSRHLDQQLNNIDLDVLKQFTQHPFQAYVFFVRKMLKTALRTQQFAEIARHGLVMQQMHEFRSQRAEELATVFARDPAELQRHLDEGTVLPFLLQLDRVSCGKCLAMLDLFALEPRSGHFHAQSKQLSRLLDGPQLARLVHVLNEQSFAKISQVSKGVIQLIPPSTALDSLHATIQSSRAVSIQNQFLRFNYNVLANFCISVLLKNFEQLEAWPYDFGDLLVQFEFAAFARILPETKFRSELKKKALRFPPLCAIGWQLLIWHLNLSAGSSTSRILLLLALELPEMHELYTEFQGK
ncbi:hypothetical protein SS50377_20324 [Spironucleus salmonicida]|uniref:Uncharacterized protein n=1 Tax=Spironucleus salmonicida TaxID=348837 RepID=A0A9P8LZ15_9EUKA|nr:hypothetical protein SS50377_20324 [Spironucleus salmonicida]